MRRKVTAADVARSAGVSPATVDRVLNGRGSVSIDKERRVVEWAIRLGIDRNIRLRPTRTIRIGVAMARASILFTRAFGWLSPAQTASSLPRTFKPW